MQVDSHQHFWRYDPVGYAWMDDRMAALRRDYLPDDLAPHLAACGIDVSVAVQARQSLEETAFLCGLAAEHDRVAGVVGWVDLRADDVDGQLDRVASPWLRGIRHVAQDEPDDRFLARADFQRGVGRLAERGLVYDILIYERQLESAIDLVRAHPDLPFVLDHVAKPRIGEGLMEPWATHLRTLATHEHVLCKVSGMVTEADWSSWTEAELQPYLDVVLEAFGPARLMYGSDWPVCTLAADYGRVFAVAHALAAHLSEAERAAFFGGNAARLYGLGG